MVRHALALLALLIPALANAQSFPKPPDVPAYVEVVPTYAAGTTANVPIDSSITPPPVVELTDIPTASPASYKTTGSYTGFDFCVLYVNGGSDSSCQEAKFRTEANATKVLFDDPIRNYGQPGASHCHQFFGNQHVNAYSTFASLRTVKGGRSKARGGPLNATAYWHPCVIKTNPFGDGKNYIVRDEVITIYYAEDPAQGRQSTYLPLGLRYVTGTNMDDPNDTRMQGFIDTANAQPGTSGRYRLTNPGSGLKAASPKIFCTGATGPNSDGTSPRFVNADGTDPLGGTCAAGALMTLRINGARCWDGNNLWSPGGYKNVIPEIWDNVASAWVCPTNYYRIPGLVLQIRVSQNGPTDYMNWRLSSDDMMQAKLAALGTPRTVLSFESFHMDWMNGWDRTILHTWLDNCIGVRNGTGHQCDTSTISSTERLSNVLFDSTETHTTTTASGMWQVPAQSNGPATIHVNGH